MPDFDPAALVALLDAELDAPVADVEVLADGLNFVATVDTAETEDAFVLRSPNKLRDTDMFNDLAVEYRALDALRDTEIPAPDPVWYCGDESVLGAPFFVATHLPGETVPLGSDLPERFRDPERRRAFSFAVVDALADLHAVDTERLAGTVPVHTVADQVAADRERVARVERTTGDEFPLLRSVGDWLAENAPERADTTPVHGDFRPGNLLFSSAATPEVVGVLDWETVMLGDPLTELGYLLLRWRDDGDPTPDVDAIAEQYPDSPAVEELRERNESGFAPFTTDPGSPTRREVVARYEDRTGRSFEHERFYRANAAFMLGAVWADLHRVQVEAGGDSDWPPHVEYVARVADSIASGEFDL